MEESLERIALISPTLVCNSDCWMCGGIRDVRAKPAPIEAVKKAIDSFLERGITTLQISGGEPFAYKQLVDVVGYAKQSGIGKVVIFTNGSLITESRLSGVLSAGVDAFLVSLHAADPYIGDIVSNRRYSYRKTIFGLNCLREAKKVHSISVTISCVLSKYTERDVHRIAYQAAMFNVDNFQITYPNDTKEEISRIHVPSLTALRNSVPKAIEILTDYGIRPAIQGLPPCVYVGYEQYYTGAYPFYFKEDMVYFDSSCEGVFEERRYKSISEELMFFKPEKCLDCFYTERCKGFPLVLKESLSESGAPIVTKEDAIQTLLNRMKS